MSIENILEGHHIEYKPEESYTTLCPKCLGERSNDEEVTLQVYLEDEVVVWQCYRDKCDWKERQVHYMKTQLKKKKTFETLPWGEAEFDSSFTKDLWENSTKYPYYDSSDRLWFYVLRQGEKENKLIRPISRLADGKYSLTRPNKDLMPYRIEHYDPKKPTLIVEGEKAAEYAAKIATKSNVLTWVGGSKAIKQTDWSILNGAEVTFWPDADEPGEQCLKTFRGLCIPKKLYKIDTSSLEDKSDIADITDMAKIGQLFRDRIVVDLDYTSSHQYTVEALMEEFSKAEDYIKFGFPGVDDVVQIPEPGLTVFTARTNHGKTQSLLRVGYSILKDTDKTVLYVSYEESGKKVLKRFLKAMDAEYCNKYATSSYFEYDDYISKSFVNKESKAAQQLHEYLESNKLRVYDVTTPVEEILRTLNRLKALGKSVVAVLDYAQRMPAIDGEQRYLTLKKQMEQLVNLSNQNGQAILTAAQVTNSESGYADAARESKDIEFSADLHINVWNKPSGLASGINLHENVDGDIVWIVKKSRQDRANGRKFGFDSRNGCDLKEVTTTNKF